MITEASLENATVVWLKEAGWAYIHGEVIAPDGKFPERLQWRETMLRPRLLTALKSVNPGITDDALEAATHAIESLSEPNLTVRNRAFHRIILSGIEVPVDRDGTSQPDLVRYIDFENPSHNDFLVVNQFTVKGAKRDRRPDLVLFVNGLPLAVVELKNPADENVDIWDAYNQIQTYKDELGDLLSMNEVLVISDGITARMGSLTADRERFLPWRAVKDEDDRPVAEYELETLIKGLFETKRFLEFVRSFVLFEADGTRLIKKIAGYHQFHAVREAVAATIIASRSINGMVEGIHERRADYGNKVVAGSRKAGVVWHTQGSGKSITMALYAGKLLQEPEMRNPTIVVVTDRNDLDSQLFGTFSAASELLKGAPVQAESRDDLRSKLAERQSGGVIFTTVQKFALLAGEKYHPLLSHRQNVVVISDEAHRSHYATAGKLNQKTGEYRFGHAQHLRDALPNATFIGFTGTPIAREDRDTRAVFGDYVSIYDIQDAVKDGATVPIYFESRLAKLDIHQAEIEVLSSEVDDILEDEEDAASRESAKGKWAQLAALVGAAPRLKEVAEDIVEHFELRTSEFPGKGMIVAMSRDICAALYKEIVTLRPEWHSDDPERGAIKVIMTGSAADKTELQPHLYSSMVKKRLEKRFKDSDDPLQLVIVRDMWLTGFDAPSCHTMYVDKPMHGHNLMQAIARVNRVFADKPGGLVVDYIGIAADLRRALKIYVDANGKGEPAIDTAAAVSEMLRYLDAVRGQFHGFDYADFESEGVALLPWAMQHITELPGRKERFLDTMAGLRKAYALCSTTGEAIEVRTEVAFLDAVRVNIFKFTTVDKKRTEAEKHSLLKQILDNAVVAQGVDDIFGLAGIDKPEIGLMSEEFLDSVRDLKQKNLAAELLERLMRDSIKSKLRTNIVQEAKFSERLTEAVRKYHQRAIDAAQVIEILIKMAKEFQHSLHREDELGLNADEAAFYDALIENDSARELMDDETLKKIAREITEKLRRSTTVDWAKRESVRARLRILVRRTLQFYKYPPKKTDDAIDLVLKQAEALSESWTN